MTAPVGTGVQRSPFRVPIEGNAILILAEIVQLLEGIEPNSTRSIHVKQAECDLVLSVRFVQEVLESGPIQETELASSAPISDTEQDAIVLAFNFVLIVGKHWVSCCCDSLLLKQGIKTEKAN